MRNNFKSHSVKRLLTVLFAPKVTTDMHKLHPIAYYRRIYLSKPMFEGLEFIAATERKSKIRMTNELMERGIRSYFGEKLGKYIEDDIEARKRGERATVTRFIRELRKLAKSKGMDISKFI
jgi:hypothetical protein